MQLNIKQRFVVVVIYVALILGLGYYFTDRWDFVIDTTNKLNAVLIATGLTNSRAQDTWTQKADFGGTARRGAVGFSIGSKGYIGIGKKGI